MKNYIYFEKISKIPPKILDFTKNLNENISLFRFVGLFF